MSRNYGTGDISEKLFIQTIEDYLQFARNKYDRYQNANKGS